MTDEIYKYNKNLPNGGGSPVWVPDNLKALMDKYKLNDREPYYKVIARAMVVFELSVR